jgi:alpha-mannosidase
VAARKVFKGTEMFWAPSPSQPLQGGVLGFLPYWYYAPRGFNFGGDDSTQPVMDQEGLEDNNVADVVARFNALVADQLTFTAGNDVMLMMATDFSGENAPVWFRNIDSLIRVVNANGTYHALYSTPSIYTAAKAASTPLPLRTEDVMPYADGPHAFWSGYFTSRAALKGYVRDSSAVFQVSKFLQFATGGVPDSPDLPTNPLYLLERAMGVTQHHDAVSGTSKQAVADDYARYALPAFRAQLPAPLTARPSSCADAWPAGALRLMRCSAPHSQISRATRLRRSSPATSPT